MLGQTTSERRPASRENAKTETYYDRRRTNKAMSDERGEDKGIGARGKASPRNYERMPHVFFLPENCPIVVTISHVFAAVLEEDGLVFPNHLRTK